MLVLPNQLLFWALSTSEQCFASFQPIWCHPHTQIRITLFQGKRMSIPNWKPSPNRIFSNWLSHNSPAKGWPYRFRSRGTTRSSILDHDFGHVCRGRRIQMSGHSDLGIFSNFGASSIFTWCKQILRKLLVLSNLAVCLWYPWPLLLTFVMLMILVQWILLQHPESSFTISPRSTTRPMYFWCFVSNSAFIKWHMSIHDAKWTFAPDVLASSITSFLLLTFVRFHAEIFSNFSHSLSTAAFAAGIFIAWGIGINLYPSHKWLPPIMSCG